MINQSLDIELLHRIAHILKVLPYLHQFVLHKLRIGQESDKHTIQGVVLLQKVLVRQLQFGALWDFLLPIKQNVLIYQVSKHLALLLKPVDRQVDRDDGRLQAGQKGLLGEALVLALTDSPQEILIAQFVDLIQRVGHFDLFIKLSDPFLHLLLSVTEVVQVLLHLLVARVCFLDLCLELRCYLLLLSLDLLKLLLQFLILFLKELDLLVFPFLQLFIEFLYLLEGLLLLVPQHLPSHIHKSPPLILYIDLPHYTEHASELLAVLNGHSCVPYLVESRLQSSFDDP